MEHDDAPFARPNHLATLSLVTGATVLTGHMLLACTMGCQAVLLAVPTVAGLASGYLGVQQAKQHLGIGREVAIAGIILNAISLALSLLWLLGWTAVSMLAAAGSLL